MHVEKKRIFLGNLPPCINESEIEKQFSHYGKVISVDIKQRKVNVDENISPVFAFVNIEIDNSTLQKCFQDLSDYNWQGYYITLELAKENFLDRLKREREEAQAKNVQNNLNLSKSMQQPTSTAAPNTRDEDIVKQNGIYKTTKSLESSSSSSDSDENDEIEINSNQNKNKTFGKLAQTKQADISSSKSDSSDGRNELIDVANTFDDDGIKLVIKNNKHKTIENGLKIESVNSTPIHIITKKSTVKEIKDQKAVEADEKRKQSLKNMKNSYMQQKLSIRNALAKVDSKQNKKTFSKDEEQSNKRKDCNNDNTPHKKQKLSLFEDQAGEENDDLNFEIKNQFEGRRGQKLLELQSKYTNDKRFTLDDRFADEDDEYDTNIQPDDEKNQQLEILESVLGQKVRKDLRADNSTQIPKGMLRYDPSKPEHSKFQIKRDKLTKKEKHIKRKVVDAPAPEVSKEKFYEVKENLKESLKEKESFSLLSMFGRTEERYENEPEMPEKIQKNNKFEYNKNPFKYDSSDTEDEDQNKQETHKKKNDEQLENRSSFRWAESFFFELDDKRLKDGVDFLQNMSSGDPESFKEKRRTLQRMIYRKVKNVDYGKRKLERKQRKRIKVKKAKKS